MIKFQFQIMEKWNKQRQNKQILCLKLSLILMKSSYMENKDLSPQIIKKNNLIKHYNLLIPKLWLCLNQPDSLLKLSILFINYIYKVGRLDKSVNDLELFHKERNFVFGLELHFMINIFQNMEFNTWWNVWKNRPSWEINLDIWIMDLTLIKYKAQECLKKSYNGTRKELILKENQNNISML